MRGRSIAFFLRSAVNSKPVRAALRRGLGDGVDFLDALPAESHLGGHGKSTRHRRADRRDDVFDTARGLEQRRASVVAFANLARKGDQNFPGFTEMVLDNCSHLLGSQERFVQTGVGWVLRELGRSDQDRVIGFVEANLERFSREALKNATKYLPPEVAERLLQTHLPSGNRSRRR